MHCPPTGSGGEADAELLADLAVVIGGHVGGVGANADHAQYIGSMPVSFEVSHMVAWFGVSPI